MSDVLLVLNVGSSSIKFGLYLAAEENAAPLLRGKISGIRTQPAFTLAAGARTAGPFGFISPAEGLEDLTLRLLQWLDEQPGFGAVVAVGHRVVHGGTDFAEPVRIDADVLQRLGALEPLAPLHQPYNLAAIRAVSARHSDLPQIACFDTAFHATQEPLARMFALPRDIRERGVQRYGFHGLSYDYIASQLPLHMDERADGRVLVAHLGNGASMCAMKQRRSVATSMGFTALDGLMMGRRCGTLDAGVVLYMMREMSMQADEIEDMLYRRSGLLGVSGISSDMRELEDSDDPAATQAVDLFCYRAAVTAGSLVSAMGGLDAIVFTAGIGENSPTIRQRICERLAWLGVELDAGANAANRTRIAAPGARVDALVLKTDEEHVIAQAVRRLRRGA